MTDKDGVYSRISVLELPYPLVLHPGLVLSVALKQQHLLSLLYGVRQQDYCLAREEHELGVHAIAVPLRNPLGHTLAALNVVLSLIHISEPTRPY